MSTVYYDASCFSAVISFGWDASEPKYVPLRLRTVAFANTLTKDVVTKDLASNLFLSNAFANIVHTDCSSFRIV
jgi:hypothetical protein